MQPASSWKGRVAACWSKLVHTLCARVRTTLFHGAEKDRLHAELRCVMTMLRCVLMQAWASGRARPQPKECRIARVGAEFKTGVRVFEFVGAGQCLGRARFEGAGPGGVETQGEEKGIGELGGAGRRTQAGGRAKTRPGGGGAGVPARHAQPPPSAAGLWRIMCQASCRAGATGTKHWAGEAGAGKRGQGWLWGVGMPGHAARPRMGGAGYEKWRKGRERHERLG